MELLAMLAYLWVSWKRVPSDCGAWRVNLLFRLLTIVGPIFSADLARLVRV